MLKRILIVILPLSLLFLIGACRQPETYSTTFDERGNWAAGETADVNGQIANGRYELTVLADRGAYWTTAGEQFGNGVFEVEATQLSGTLDAGYGLMVRVDNETDSFYLLEISSDGFVWIGLCEEACTSETILVGDNPAGWNASDAVQQGLNATNVLRVEADAGNLIFFVNGTEVGRRTDNTLSRGDIGLLVETLGAGDVTVAFDNVTVSPLDG